MSTTSRRSDEVRCELGVSVIPSASATPSSSGRSASPLIAAARSLAAFRADDLPLIGGGDTYYAAFTEAGGLKANDEVRIAGVRVGKVDAVDLDGDHVEGRPSRSTPTRSSARDTGAAIKVKTLLGAMFLALEPAGGGQLEEGSTIPVERTTSPYDVVEAFAGLAAHHREDRHRPARRRR